MYQTFYIVLFVAVYSSASPVEVTKDVLMNQFELEPISTDAAIEKPPENPANTSYVDLMFTKNYTDFALSAYANETFICPNLTTPECETKEATNILLKKCEVCVIEKGESCDPFLDGCEAGTICFPTTFDLSENVCAEFDAEKFFEETKSIKKNKHKTKAKSGKKNKKKSKKQHHKKHHDKKDHKKRKHNKFIKMIRKFHESKMPCGAHWIHLDEKYFEDSWELECAKDGFYSVVHRVCWESKCWCVDRMGRYVKRAPKNPKKTC